MTRGSFIRSVTEIVFTPLRPASVVSSSIPTKRELTLSTPGLMNNCPNEKEDFPCPIVNRCIPPRPPNGSPGSGSWMRFGGLRFSVWCFTMPSTRWPFYFRLNSPERCCFFFRPLEPFFGGAFILISGISSQLSRSNLKRGAKLLPIALAIHSCNGAGRAEFYHYFQGNSFPFHQHASVWPFEKAA